MLKNKNKKKINEHIPLIALLITYGISIPHFCYHNDLSVAGNCRVCLVELKNSMKPIVSCATSGYATFFDAMLYYDSAMIKKARENIIEFLLVNHPLDCPICDQGGDCDLQDQAAIFGSTQRRFFKFKRAVVHKNVGSIVKTVMTRCIHCTRCVRFANELAGTDNLGIVGRGRDNEIGTYLRQIVSSEVSASITDLCARKNNSAIKVHVWVVRFLKCNKTYLI